VSAADSLAGRNRSLIGEVLGDRYEILRQLSMGGMGMIYEARHVVVGRHFAVKVLHPESATRPGLVKRFEQEAKAVGSLASEHIVGVLDFGEHFGIPYFVMELLQGRDLRDLLLTSGALPVPRAVGIALDVCNGLRLAHAAGLTHRDLKPANIFVTHTSEGRELAKVIDFGVAKLLNASESTGEDTLIGTVGYMAPEQIHSGKAVDSRADIYSLGVVLYEMLAGTAAHQGEKAEVLYRILHEQPPELDQVRKNLPRALVAVVNRATARDPEHRHRTIAELAEALKPYAYPGGASTAGNAHLKPDSDDASASKPTLSASDDSAHDGARGVSLLPRRRLSSRARPILGLALVGALTASSLAWLHSPRTSPSLANVIRQSEFPPGELPPLMAKGPGDVAKVGPRAPPLPEPAPASALLPGPRRHDEAPSLPLPRNERSPALRARRADPPGPAALDLPAPLPVFDSVNPYASPSPYPPSAVVISKP
jgi:serine/threonine-protein kinase